MLSTSVVLSVICVVMVVGHCAVDIVTRMCMVVLFRRVVCVYVFFVIVIVCVFFFCFQAEDGIRDLVRSRGLGDVYKRQVGGPVLSIPFWINVKDEKGNTVQEKRFAHFLPDELNIKGEVNPEQRHRGIYVVVLYNAVLQVLSLIHI